MLRVAHHQELDAGQRLRAVQLEGVRLQLLDARRARLGAELHGERVQRGEHGGQDDLLVGGGAVAPEFEVERVILLRIDDGHDLKVRYLSTL